MSAATSQPIDLAIDGATIVTPAGRRRASVLVAGGRIAGFGSLDDPAGERVDAGGLLLLPGFVDTHVHLMEPAAPEREDWAHGTRAAAGSGVTTIVEHTHASPVRTAADLAEKLASRRDASLVDFGLAAHAWPDRISEVEALWAAGVTFFKIFTCTTHGVPGFEPGPLREVLREVARVGGVCLVHCEDESLTEVAEATLRASGRTDAAVITEWRDRDAETVAVRTATELARSTGARIVVAHASHAGVVADIEAARLAGAPVLTESCPQYLTLREDEILEHGALRKFTPPARARVVGDLDAMWQALERGAIHHISSDHAPSTLEQKRHGSIWDSHFGLPGLDTTSSVLIDACVRGVLSWERLADAYAAAPARVYALAGKGRLEVGADADLVLIDPTGERTLRNEDIRSKAGWTPFAGRQVRGRVVSTYLRGRRIAHEGIIEAEPGAGRFIAGAGASGD
jgi:dihydroorotase (multifunctional complex type)